MKIIDFLNENRNKINQDLSQLIAIETYFEKQLISPVNPLGDKISESFSLVQKICEREQLSFINYDNYCCEVEAGSGSEVLGILVHIDTVKIYQEDKWLTNPFELVIDEENYYGRGVNDNKGPLIYMLYLLKYLQDLELSIKIRLIIGGAEETSWLGIKHYFEMVNRPQPKWGISPDGNFPIVNCEKGAIFYKYILNIVDDHISKIESEVDRATNCHRLKAIVDGQELNLASVITKSRHPNYENNAGLCLLQQNPQSKIAQVLADFQDTSGKRFGLEQISKGSYQSTLNISAINYLNNKLEVEFEFRYINPFNYQFVNQVFNNKLINNGGELIVEGNRELLYIGEDSQLLRAMKASFENVTDTKAELLTMGGASYARILEHGLSFGPAFPNEVTNSHQPNEKMAIRSLDMTCEIYLDLIIRLSGGVKHER